MIGKAEKWIILFISVVEGKEDKGQIWTYTVVSASKIPQLAYRRATIRERMRGPGSELSGKMLWNGFRMPVIPSCSYLT